jgi:hypothetical protein
MKPPVDEQIERILDEGRGRRRSVIVRMSSTEEEIQELSSTASEAIRKRNLAQSARDVVPLSLDKMRLPESGKRTDYMKRQLRAADQSVAAQVAAYGVQEVTKRGLRSRNI